MAPAAEAVRACVHAFLPTHGHAPRREGQGFTEIANHTQPKTRRRERLRERTRLQCTVPRGAIMPRRGALGSTLGAVALFLVAAGCAASPRVDVRMPVASRFTVPMPDTASPQTYNASGLAATSLLR